MNTSAAIEVWGDSHKGDDGFGGPLIGKHGLVRVNFLPRCHQCRQAGVAPTFVSVVSWAVREGDHRG